MNVIMQLDFRKKNLDTCTQQKRIDENRLNYHATKDIDHPNDINNYWIVLSQLT